MIGVMGSFRFPVEQMPAARTMMQAVILATRAEDGCIEYNFAEDLVDPGLIRVSERWESRAHLDAHLKAPHMATWAEQRAGLGLSDRKLVVLEIASATPL